MYQSKPQLLLAAALLLTSLSCAYGQSIQWQSGYPAFFTGASTADIIVKSKENLNVYIAIYAAEQNDITSQQIIDEASSLSSALIATQKEVSADEETTIEITELTPESKYHMYITYSGTSGLLPNQYIIYEEFDTPERQIGYEDFKIANRVQGYLLYIPEEHLKYKKTTPITIFFHGQGEQSDDHTNPQFNKLRGAALPKYIDDGNDVPLIVIAPQTSVSWSQSDPDEVLDALYNFVLHKTNANPAQRYITGISDGGGAVYSYMRTHADNLAAALPIATYPKPKDYEEDGTINEIAKIPTWLFIGSEDGFGGSRGLYNKLSDLGADVKFTFYDGVGHNSWDRTYNLSGMNASNINAEYDPYDVSVYDWLLTKSKSSAPVYTESEAPNSPAAPSLTFAGDSFAYIQWTESNDEDLHYYEIHQKKGDGTFALLDTAINNAYFDNSLAAGLTYEYKLKAVDFRGNKSSFGATLSFETEADEIAPEAVTGLTITAQGEDFISLSWQANEEVDLVGYNLYKSINSENFSTILSKTQDLSFTDSGLETDISYRYFITAVDASENESTSSEIVETILESNVLSANNPEEETFNIYPNPSTGNYVILENLSTDGVYSFEILNIQGQTIFTSSSEEKQLAIPYNFKAGIYTIRITDSKHEVSTKRFIINQ